MTTSATNNCSDTAASLLYHTLQPKPEPHSPQGSIAAEEPAQTDGTTKRRLEAVSDRGTNPAASTGPRSDLRGDPSLDVPLAQVLRIEPAPPPNNDADIAAELGIAANEVLLSVLVGGLVSALTSALAVCHVREMSTLALGRMSADLDCVARLQPDTEQADTFTVWAARARHELDCRDTALSDLQDPARWGTPSTNRKNNHQ